MIGSYASSAVTFPGVKVQTHTHTPRWKVENLSWLKAKRYCLLNCSRRVVNCREHERRQRGQKDQKADDREYSGQETGRRINKRQHWAEIKGRILPWDFTLTVTKGLQHHAHVLPFLYSPQPWNLFPHASLSYSSSSSPGDLWPWRLFPGHHVGLGWNGVHCDPKLLPELAHWIFPCTRRHQIHVSFNRIDELTLETVSDV